MAISRGFCGVSIGYLDASLVSALIGRYGRLVQDNKNNKGAIFIKKDLETMRSYLQVLHH